MPRAAITIIAKASRNGCNLLKLGSVLFYLPIGIVRHRSTETDGKTIKPTAIRTRRQRVMNRIPDEILNDPDLTKAMENVTHKKKRQTD